MKVTGNYRLSPQQRHLWFQQAAHAAAFRAACAVSVEGNINAERLKKTLEIVVGRHEILRTVFQTPSGMTVPVQTVCEQLDTSLFVLDLSSLPGREQTDAIESVFSEAQKQPSSAETGSLSATLVRLAPRRQLLILSLPAIAADEKSLTNLVGEIAELYAADSPESLLDEPFQYADFSEWQNERLETEDEEPGRKHWQSEDFRFNANFYSEQKNAVEVGFQPEIFGSKIDPETARRIGEAAAENGVTTETFLLGCWQILLSHLSGEAEFAIGLQVDGRKFQEMETALGLFAGYVPVQLNIAKDAGFAGFLNQAEAASGKAAECQEFFDWKPFKTGADEPFLAYCFEFYAQPNEIRAGESVFKIIRRDACLDRFKAKLKCVETADDGVQIEFHYDRAKFESAEISRVADCFQQLIASAIENPSAEIGALEILSKAEQRRLLEESNRTETDYRRDATAHRLFEEHAAQTPEKHAVVCENETLTYAELNERANRLARHLRARGVEPETLCGICVERSVEMAISILAVFKAGGAYVPLDPSYPQDRLAFMLADSKPKLLIGQKRLLDELPANEAQKVLLDADTSEIARHSGENLEERAKPEHPAYLIYTSGSTGSPKGVVIRRDNLAHYVQSLPAALKINNGDRYLHTASISFSSSVRQLMVPLANGATVVIATQEQIRNPRSLFELVKNERATVVDLVPSYWRNCLYALDNLPSAEQRELLDNDVRLALSASEPLPADVPRQLAAKFKPGVRLVNMLGQTETTGIIATHPIENPENVETGIVPAGRPIGNTKIYLLDGNLKPVPFGAPGEIYIGGCGVGNGYLNQPELTAQHFVSDPFDENRKLYKTGDFGRYLADGQIEFLGRIDNQVKIRGHRVELGEIETVLRAHEMVHEAVVTVRDDAEGGQKLAAYVVPKPANAPTVAGRERYRLPNNMFIAQQNKYETDFFYEQIFKDQTNFKHGIELADGACVVDVGANIGFFTMFVQQRWKNVRGYAFEPIPAIFETLKINTALYGNDTKLFRCGLAEEAKEVVFTYYPNSSTQSGRYADEQEEREVLRSIIGNQEIETGVAATDQYFDRLVEERIHGEKVVCPLKTLSEVMRENQIEQIDLLKIDAEKSEFDVLRGIEENDWAKIKQITIEAHDINGGLKRLTDLLEKHGFTVFAEEDAFIKNSGLYNVYATRKPKNRISAAESNEAPYEIPVFENQILNSAELRQYLKDRLPEYFLPANFVLLESLPLSPNGKIDRAALPEPEENRKVVETEFVRAKDELEIRLTKIWENLLKVEPVGTTDNFFDLGGHSLLAVRLFTQIEKIFGEKLPLATLFEAPTIEKLAVLLRQEGWTPSWSSLVTLHAGDGAKRPFFCVHALGGNVLEYQPLARLLGADQPFYGLQSYGLDKNHVPHSTIEEMAGHYIKEMQTVQPEGPYLLGGRSLGGTVAFQMACQLQEQNQEVALLALLDTDPMGYHKLLPENSGDFRKAQRFMKRAKGHLSNLSTLSVGEQIAYFKGKSRYVPGKIKNKIWQAVHKMFAKSGREMPGFLQSVQEYNFMAVMNYVPKIYRGRVTLFWAIEDLRGSYDVQEGWDFLAQGGVETHDIPGNHLDIVKEPYVGALAEKLKSCIERAQAGDQADDLLQTPVAALAAPLKSESYDKVWSNAPKAAANY